MKIYNIGIDLKRTFTDVLRGIVQHEDVLFKTVISDDGKPIDYSTCNIIMIAVRMPDYTTEKTLETINIQTANATKGIVEFKLPKEFTEQEGVHQLQISFFDKGNMVKTARLNYCVEDGLLLDEPSETEIVTTEDLLRKASEALVASEEIGGAESVRNASEESRNAAEEARVESENKRNSAETLREKRETARYNGEADRKEAEDIRLENEAERIENEIERGNNENKRIMAESKRENKLNNMDINAISIDSESEAYAETLITENSISVTIGVPKGEKGDKGDKGEKGDSGKSQPHYVFDASVDVYTKRGAVVREFETVEITEAFNGGRMVIASIQIVYWNDDGETEDIQFANLICTGTRPISFFGVANSGDHVFIENHGDDWVCYIYEAVSKYYVESAIGDIETSLENIITKYGLGGEA